MERGTLYVRTRARACAQEADRARSGANSFQVRNSATFQGTITERSTDFGHDPD